MTFIPSVFLVIRFLHSDWKYRHQLFRVYSLQAAYLGSHLSHGSILIMNFFKYMYNCISVRVYIYIYICQGVLHRNRSSRETGGREHMGIHIYINISIFTSDILYISIARWYRHRLSLVFLLLEIESLFFWIYIKEPFPGISYPVLNIQS